MSLGSLVSFWLRRFRPRQHKRRPFRKPRLWVECLEERTVFDTGLGASLTPNASFVNNLYIDLLHRQPGPSEIAGWASALDAGSSRSQVALGFLGSTEFRGEVIENDYLTFLHRNADADGLAGWQSRMANGLTAQRLLASILSSNEYVQDQGGTTTGWLTGLYRDLLGRAPDAAGLAGWTASLQSGTALYAVALGMVNSPELYGLQVTGAYQSMLARSPDPTGFNGWVASMEGGLTLEKMTLGIDGSDEYFSKATEIREHITPLEIHYRASFGGIGSNLSGFGAASQQPRVILSPNRSNSPLGPGSGGSGGGAFGGGSPLAPNNINVSNNPGNDWSEIAMDVNPTNPMNIVIFGTLITTLPTSMDAFYTFDGGATWTDVVIDSSIDGVTNPNSLRGDPTVAFDVTGRLYIGYLVDGDVTSPTSDFSYIVVAHSTDGGKTYQAVNALKEAKGATSIFDDKELLGTGPAPGNPKQQNVYVAWTLFDNTGARNQTSVPEIIGSTDGGITWSAPTVVGDPGDTNTQFVTPRVGPNGEIDVTFIQNNIVEFKSSPSFTSGTFAFGGDITVVTLNNPSFTTSIPAQPSRGISSIPVLAVDDSPGPFRGELYVAYADLPAGGSSPNFDIFVVTSVDGGNTWSSPLKVNDDTGTNSHFNPWIAVDQLSGCVALEWRDARNDPINKRVNIFAATSMDGGASFGANVQISANPSDESGNTAQFLNNFLEYDGLANYNGNEYFAWSDNSADPNGNKAIFYANIASGCFPIVPPPPPPPPGGVILPDDQFDPNETSDTAHDFGTLAAGTQTFANLTINIHANGLPDYDWFKWTAGQSGTYTSTINYTPVTTGDLELRVYTRDASGMLILLGSSLNTGVTTQTVSVSVTNGEPLYAEIDGLNHIQATYTMTVSLM